MLTLGQQLQAKEEGWKLVGGYVSRAFDAKGYCPFHCGNDIVAYLHTKALSSEWHRDVYIALAWTAADNELSFKEGWILEFDEIHTRAITIFPTDEDAQSFVQAGIEAGNPLHLKAIRTLAKRRLLYGDQ